MKCVPYFLATVSFFVPGRQRRRNTCRHVVGLRSLYLIATQKSSVVLRPVGTAKRRTWTFNRPDGTRLELGQALRTQRFIAGLL